jgi:hypothetical protein
MSQIVNEPVRPDHLAILERGVDEWNEWKKRTTEEPNLMGQYFFCKQWTGIDFSKTNLFGCVFHGIDLPNSDFSGASLAKADITWADWPGVSFKGAYFCYTNFVDVDLRGADFTNAIMEEATFANCDLRGAKGLDRVKHRRPSTVGIDTIYHSRGEIPDEFLRGCGVPEHLITYIPSLISAMDGLQFYSCFISYSSKDEEFVRRLHARMREADLRVWFAPEDIRGGQKLHHQIDAAIRSHDKVLVVLSPSSMNSEWVLSEMRKARKAELETGRRKLFPIRLTDIETLRSWECFDADTGRDIAVEIREYFIPDFSNWRQQNDFENAFHRLINDLKAEP